MHLRTNIKDNLYLIKLDLVYRITKLSIRNKHHNSVLTPNFKIYFHIVIIFLYLMIYLFVFNVLHGII